MEKNLNKAVDESKIDILDKKKVSLTAIIIIVVSLLLLIFGGMYVVGAYKVKMQSSQVEDLQN